MDPRPVTKLSSRFQPLQGFRKVDPDRWEFANDGFTQGSRDNLHQIQRRKPNATLQRPAQALPQTSNAGQPSVPPFLDPLTAAAAAVGYGMSPRTSNPAAASLLMSQHAQMAKSLGLSPRSAGVPGAGPQLVKPAMPLHACCFSCKYVLLTSRYNVLRIFLIGGTILTSAGVPAELCQPLPITALDASMPSGAGSGAEPSGAYGVASGAQRIERLRDDYLRPGQQVLAAITNSAGGGFVPSLGDSNGAPAAGVKSADYGASNGLSSNGTVPSSSSSHEPCSSASADDMGGGECAMDVEEAHKAMKRSRSEAYNQGHGVTSIKVESSPGEGAAGAAAAVPSGVGRPVPRHTGTSAGALLSKMAGQLGRLSGLANEVNHLKEENSALRRNMLLLSQSLQQQNTFQVSNPVLLRRAGCAITSAPKSCPCCKASYIRKCLLLVRLLNISEEGSSLLCKCIAEW